MQVFVRDVGNKGIDVVPMGTHWFDNDPPSFLPHIDGLIQAHLCGYQNRGGMRTAALFPHFLTTPGIRFLPDDSIYRVDTNWPWSRELRRQIGPVVLPVSIECGSCRRAKRGRHTFTDVAIARPTAAIVALRSAKLACVSVR